MRDDQKTKVELLQELDRLRERVSELKQAKEKLHKSEQRYRSLTDDILDISKVGIFILDDSFKVVWLNQALERYFGLRRKDVIGKDKRQLIRKQIKDIFEEPETFVEKVFATYDNNTYIENFECHVLADGQRENRWLEHWSQPIPSGLFAGGRIEHYTDITERKKAEQALAESEEKFRSIFDNANDIIASVTKTGKILEVNKKIEDMLGYKPDELVGKNILTSGILAKKNAATIVKLFKKSVKRGRLLDIRDGRNVTEVWVNHKDGHTVLLEANTTTIKEDGKSVGYLSVIRDITERKREEEALRESQENYRMVSRLTSDYIVKTKVEPNGQMVFVSATDRLEKMTGYAVEELRSQSSWSKIVHPDDFDKFQDFWKRIVSSRKSCELEFRGIDRKQQFEWLHAYGQPILDEKNDRVISIVFAAKDITKRKLAEEGLLESEERYRGVVEDTPVLICCFLPGGEITFVNKTYCEYFTKTPEELVGSNFLSLIPETDRETVMASISALTVESPTQSHEHRVIAPGGKIRWQRWTNRALFDAQGKNVAYQSIGEDITERKKAEEAYRSLVDHSLQGLAIFQNGRVVFANQAMADITGYTVEEMLTLPPEQVQAFVHPDDRELVWSQHRDRLNSEELPERYEFRGIRKDGSICWLEIHASRIEFQGKPAFQVAYVDITERKKAEEALNESEQKYRTLVESAGESIATINEDGVFLFINRTGAERFGGKPKDYIGKTMWDLFPKKIADRQAASVRKVIHTKEGRNEIALTGRQGQLRWYNTTLEPLRDSSGKVIAAMVVARDIHKLKQAEEELNKYRAHMAQAEQLASVGTLSATLAHELTQPLTVIRLSIQNSLAELETVSCPDTVVEDLKEGLSEISNMTSMVNRFRNFARISTKITVSKVDLKAVAERIVKLLDESAWRAKVTIRVEGMDKLTPIYTCERELEKLFFSLIENSIQAANGKKSRQVIISGDVRDEHIELQFSDNCGGIAPENLDRIFEPFFTTKSSTERTGLGLCVVERIVSQLGGKVRVESKLGKGSTFFITLPIKRDER